MLRWVPAAARGLLIAVVSPAAEHGALGAWASVVVVCWLSSCGARAQPLPGTWDPPGPGLEPVPPAPAGGPPTTAPPGKPSDSFFLSFLLLRPP